MIKEICFKKNTSVEEKKRCDLQFGHVLPNAACGR